MKGQSVNKSIQNERLSLKVNLSPSKFKPVKTAFPNVDLTLKRHQIDTAAAALLCCAVQTKSNLWRTWAQQTNHLA